MATYLYRLGRFAFRRRRFVVLIWLGLLAPKGTPKAVIDRLNEAVSKIASQPAVRQEWGRQGATPMVMTPADFEKYIQDDIAKWARVIKSANIKAE